MFHAGLQVLDSTLPAAHVTGRSYRALSDASTQRPQASRTHVGYLPKVDDMLGLTESPSRASQGGPLPDTPGNAAAEDPFAASAHVHPDSVPGSSGDARSGQQAEGAGTAEAAGEDTVLERETEQLLDDSDSELEADLVFAHLMARRPGAHAVEPSAAEQPEPVAQPDEAGSTLAEAPQNPEEGFRDGGIGEPDRQAGESASAGAGEEASNALVQQTPRRADLGEASKQTQAINSDLMSSMIHSPDASAEQPPGTSHASLPPMQSEQVVTSRATQDTLAQRHAYAASTGEQPAVDSDAIASASGKGCAEGPGEALEGKLTRRLGQKRAKPSHKAVAAMWELLESCIAQPQPQETTQGTARFFSNSFNPPVLMQVPHMLGTGVGAKSRGQLSRSSRMLEGTGLLNITVDTTSLVSCKHILRQQNRVQRRWPHIAQARARSQRGRCRGRRRGTRRGRAGTTHARA